MRGRHRTAALVGAALVVPLAIGTAVVAAPPDPADTVRGTTTAAEWKPAPAAQTSPVPGHASGDADGADRAVGAVRGAGAEDRAVADPASPGAAAGDDPAAAARPGADSEQGSSLAEAAGSARPAAQAKQPAASGLAQVAGQDHGQDTAGAPADRTEGLRQRGAVTPDQALADAAAPGGCLTEYGEDGQCLPQVPPSLAQHVQDMKKAGLDPASMPHDWSCEELRTFFPEGIRVRQAGEDPQDLDTDQDGVACGAGD